MNRPRHPLTFVVLGSALLYAAVLIAVWWGIPLPEMLPLGVLPERSTPREELGESPEQNQDSPAVAGENTAGVEEPWKLPTAPAWEDVMGPEPGFGAAPGRPAGSRSGTRGSSADPLNSALQVLQRRHRKRDPATDVPDKLDKTGRPLLEALRLLEGEVRNPEKQ